MTTLVLSEVFGPTIQGEGPSSGRRAAFVRVGRCNLTCGKGPLAKWACDTPYTWDWDNYDPAQELTRVEIDDVAAKVHSMNVPMVVMTGGEPVTQQRSLLLLANALNPLDVEVETNGTVMPKEDFSSAVTRFNVSPKLENSGVELVDRYRPDVLKALLDTNKAIFKFVVADKDDLAEVDEMTKNAGIPSHLIWAMPAGTNESVLHQRSAELVDAVIERGWNMTQRLHVLMWGDTRAR